MNYIFRIIYSELYIQDKKVGAKKTEDAYVKDSNCRPLGRQKLLSACISIWMKAHKISKA